MSVEGFRCLAEIKQVPVLRQTVLTGQNEGGGKTALLDALAFLLKGTALSERDLTYLGEGEAEDAGVQARVAFSIVRHSHEMTRPWGIRSLLPSPRRC
ncbi:hypothetical protein [Kitasatospora sp. MAA4]|uniref:hypothetical protein n=1 Tax=Kitasatospora sp. MAA4 TaxID=3035093 RepID=UPI00247349FE|nr:hypothetical protein [Kitasatospora sp. MAA4]